MLREEHRDKVAGGCKKLQIEERHNLFPSLNIKRMFKLTRIRCMQQKQEKFPQEFV